jgi:hypothetical protein
MLGVDEEANGSISPIRRNALRLSFFDDFIMRRTGGK